MDQRRDECEGVADVAANVVTVCDDCCTDGSVLSTDTDLVSGFALCRNGANSGDVKCDDLCKNFTEPVDDIDALSEQSVIDIQPTSERLDDDVHSDHIYSSSNDCIDVSAAETVTSEAEVKSNDKDADIDEPVDVYKGLHLTDSWNPVRAQCRREIGVGRVSASQFTCQASASLALVYRLELDSKFDGHTGCVNALHFNESGNSIVLLLPYCYTVSQKKLTSIKLFVALSNYNRFPQFCTAGKSMKFAIQPIRYYPPHLRHVATLPSAIKNSNFLQIVNRYEKNTNKLHFKCTNLNASMRVTVHAECIYVLTEYLKDFLW